MQNESKELIVTNPETFEKWFELEINKGGGDIDVALISIVLDCIKPFVEEVKKHTIIDEASFDEVDGKTKALKKVRLLIKNLLEPEWKKIFKEYQGKKAIMDGFCNPLAAIERQKKQEMIAHNQRMERVRKEAADKAIRKAEEKAREKRDQLEREALAAMDRGDDEEAEIKVAQAEEVSPHDHMSVAQPTYMPPKGTSIKEKWVAEVTDLRVLIKAVHEGNVLINCLLPNQVYLNQRARSDKGNLRIPGVKIYNEGSVSMRT